jgi:hypothetical protein
LLYTIGTNYSRVEVTATNAPYPADILNRGTGELTLLFPHNRSYVRLKPVAENNGAMPPGFPGMPARIGQPPQAPVVPAPSNIGPTNLPGIPAGAQMPAIPQLPPGTGPQPGPGAPALPGTVALPPMAGPGGMPAMPMMPMPGEALELTATGDKTNLLGLACEKFTLKQRGEVMEVWATKSMTPFQEYVRNQRPRFGPRMIEERWGALVAEKKLFPLRAVLKMENGAERFRFEVKTITPEKLKAEDAPLFEPPAGYQEIQPLPF